MASYKSKAEEVTSNPVTIILTLLVVLFAVQLILLGNLWAINEIADYFQ